MEDKFRSLYKPELQLKSATNIAFVLNLLIVLMGIFGVIAFTLAKRNKEIAVRKVLGADSKRIINLFIKEYSWPLIIANLIAWPVAWYFSSQWLMNYAYRMHQNILYYFISTLLLIIVVVAFVALQTIKTARANPVGALRSE